MESKKESRFIALYNRHYQQRYYEADSLRKAINFLETGNDNGNLMPIAVIDRKSNKMVWYENLVIGEDVCQQMVNEFLIKLKQEKQ